MTSKLTAVETESKSLGSYIATDPVGLGGLVAGVLLFLLVRYGHMSADAAQQAIAGALPFLGSIAVRQFVTPVSKLAAAHPTATSEATTILRSILDLLSPKPAAPTVVPPASTFVNADPSPSSGQPTTIPAAPEPWVPPTLTVSPILPTPAAPAADAPAPAPEPAAPSEPPATPAG